MHEISHRPPLAVLIVVLLATGACAARPTAVSVPDSTSRVPDWAAVIAVRAGALLLVEEKGGTRVQGNLETADDQGLRLRIDGASVQVPRLSVARVVRLGGRRTARGARWGALIGAAFGVGLTAIAAGEIDGGLMLIVGALWGGVGAAGGAAVGARAREQTVIYDATTP